MEKYYTPTIDEFYVGYECETKEYLIDKDFHKITVTTDLYETDNDGINKPNCPLYQENMNLFRTKYLDDEDLSELGFTKIGKNIRYGYVDYVGDNSKIDLSKIGYYCHVTFHKCRFDDEHLIMFHRYNPITRDIEEDLKEFESEIRFRGNIRCKNELKLVLKLLNVK